MGEVNKNSVAGLYSHAPHSWPYLSPLTRLGTLAILLVPV
ncbi:hypothetical protein V22_25650 [Calycomorphotria hydatis]|uniref:Uncharacterized protein n=1 Tax=Calycomorphotria hydatis TaxID=2528027 RepID=A0A517TAB6_9PLAN|nr:hypothetical protein V22_25650 [Calycomorphotria hydatis]